MIRASAPGRCGLVGNPTDGYGGSVISCSLAERAVVEIVPADETVLEICGDRAPVRNPSDLRLNGGYADVARAVLTVFDSAVTSRKFHLKGWTDIPMQSGLAGSTAMLAAILGGVLRLLDLRLTPYEVAETVRHIEFNVMNCVCGFQDQYMTVFGGLHYLDFRDKEPQAAEDPVFATVENLEPFIGEMPLLLASTGVRRHSGTVHKGLRDRWLEREPAVVEGYERIARLAREAKKALLAEDWPCVGAAMTENHAIQRDLGGSGEANERLIAAALNAGALGAKLAGAGHGGTIVAIHEDLAYLERALREAGAARLLRVKPSEGLVVESRL
jgi:galactokinase/mevalonate kinase-like predicted kinase